MNFQVSITDTVSGIVREYDHGLYLDRPYEVALKSFVTYNNIFNVTEKNNKFVWTYVRHDEQDTPIDASSVESVDVLLLDNSSSRKSALAGTIEKRIGASDVVTYEDDDEYEVPDPANTITTTEVPKIRRKKKHERVLKEIPCGIYEIDEIGDSISSTLSTLSKANLKSEKKDFKLWLDVKTMRVQMKGNLGIDFGVPNSIGRFLGFEPAKYTANKLHISTNRIDLLPVYNIRICCNLVKTNIRDCFHHDDTVYEFPLSVVRGEKIIERPSLPTFYKINDYPEYIHVLVLQVKDQDNNLIDFRGERINIILEFRPCQ